MKNLKLNFVALATLVFGVFIFTGCSESSITEEPVSLRENGFESLRLSFLNPVIVFEYTSIENVHVGLDKALPMLLEELNQEIKEKEYSNVTVGLKFHNERAIVSNMVYSRGDKIILEDSFYFDEEVGEYLPLSSGMDLIYDEMMNGRCPSGYTNLGRCSNFRDTEDCIGGLISEYLSKNLKTMGDCANVQVSVGLSNVTVCGGGC